MSEDDYRKYIIETVKKIENVKYLKRILKYVTKCFVKPGK